MKIIDFAVAILLKENKVFMIRKLGKTADHWSVPMLSLKRGEVKDEEIEELFIPFLEETFRLKVIDCKAEPEIQESLEASSSKFFFFLISSFEGVPHLSDGWEGDWFDFDNIPKGLPVLEHFISSL